MFSEVHFPDAYHSSKNSAYLRLYRSIARHVLCIGENSCTFHGPVAIENLADISETQVLPMRKRSNKFNFPSVYSVS